MALGLWKKIKQGVANAWNKTKTAIANGAKFAYNQVLKPLATQVVNNAGTIGTAIGAYFGGPQGAKIGNTIGNLANNLVGGLNR